MQPPVVAHPVGYCASCTLCILHFLILAFQHPLQPACTTEQAAAQFWYHGLLLCMHCYLGGCLICGVRVLSANFLSYTSLASLRVCRGLTGRPCACAGSSSLGRAFYEHRQALASSAGSQGYRGSSSRHGSAAYSCAETAAHAIQRPPADQPGTSQSAPLRDIPTTVAARCRLTCLLAVHLITCLC